MYWMGWKKELLWLVCLSTFAGLCFEAAMIAYPSKPPPEHPGEDLILAPGVGQHMVNLAPPKTTGGIDWINPPPQMDLSTQFHVDSSVVLVMPMDTAVGKLIGCVANWNDGCQKHIERIADVLDQRDGWLCVVLDDDGEPDKPTICERVEVRQ